VAIEAGNSRGLPEIQGQKRANLEAIGPKQPLHARAEQTRHRMASDSASVRQMVSFTMRKAGHEVAEAVDGKDGVDKAGKEKFDMGITDLNMPNVDGIQLITLKRESVDARIYLWVPFPESRTT